HEGHFNVQLGELWLAVCTEILIAVATSDLVVALHASNLQQLLEQLWGLWQCVESAWAQTSWHQEVTCAFWGGTSQGWGLDLGEIVAVQHGACSLVGSRAQTQGVRLNWATQVQVAVLQTGLFAD